MKRLKPYYNLINERSIQSKQPCAHCDSEKAVEECWCEFGQGLVPDDYVYVSRCKGCEEVIE